MNLLLNFIQPDEALKAFMQFNEIKSNSSKLLILKGLLNRECDDFPVC